MAIKFILNCPPSLEKILKFTSLKWLKMIIMYANRGRVGVKLKAYTLAMKSRMHTGEGEICIQF